MHHTSTCTGCGKPIEWRHTPNGKRMPLDTEPLTAWAKGAYVLDGEYGCRPAEPMFDAGELMLMNHWTTCEKRDLFRKENRER
jgi:hypothetical protein